MPSISDHHRAAAEAAKGFMPTDEGEALFRWCAAAPPGARLEVGTYCGKSSVWLGAACAEVDEIFFTVDHHRGSEENQAGWEHHDTSLVDQELGVMDTLPTFRRTMHDAKLEDTVIAIVGKSVPVAQRWTTPLSFLFIDGGHGSEPAHADFENWTPHVAVGGFLAIHDVFEDPEDGGRPPFEIWCRAVETGAFEQLDAVGSLRVLRRVVR